MKALLSILIGLSTSGMAFALQCGDSVSGNITLTADLVCTGQSGLKVAADDTFIRLNGYSILCSGSCMTGISSHNHDHVVVEGPGIIDGFTFGVVLESGQGLSIHQVSITGQPLVPSLLQTTPVGIYVRDIDCRSRSPFAPDRGTSASVYGNIVQNQISGIILAYANCVEVYGNTTTRNSWNGISVTAGGHNSIFRNIVTGNGLDRAFDTGIYLTDDSNGNGTQPTTYNLVFSNTVDSNCGNGITARHANDNNVYGNTVKFNGCAPPDALSAFYDLADLGGTGNIWNPNNVCRTQTLTIPAGVCNPNE